MILVKQHEKLILRVTDDFDNKLPFNVQFISNITIVPTGNGEVRIDRLNAKASSHNKEVDLLSSVVTKEVVNISVNDYTITNNDTEDHNIEFVFVTQAGYEYPIINNLNLKAGYTIVYDGDGLTIYNPDGLEDPYSFLDLEDTPGAYQAGYFLQVNTEGTALEFVETISSSLVTYDPSDDPVTDFTNIQDAMSDQSKSIEQRLNSASGIISGGVVTKATDTTFDVALGKGEIHDSYTTPENTSIIEFEWEAILGTTLATNGLSVSSTIIFMTSSGAILQHVDPLEFGILRDNIILAVIWQMNGIITSVKTTPTVIKQTATDLQDALMRNIEIDGSHVFPVTGELQVWIEEGSLFFPGINWENDRQSPNTIELIQVGSEVVPITFTPMTRTGLLGAPTTTIPGEYNSSGDTISNLPANDATIHRLYSVGVGAEREFVLLYGQQQYADAIAARDNVITDDNLLIQPDEVNSMIFLGKICVEGNAPDFSDINDAWITSGPLATSTSGGSSTKDRTFDADKTLTASDNDKKWIYIGTGPATLTLPLAATLTDFIITVANLALDGSQLNIATQAPNTLQDNNAEIVGLITLPVSWGQNRLILRTDTQAYFEFLLDWHIALNGDWIPDTQGFQGIGDKENGPNYVALYRPNFGVSGLIKALDTSQPHWLPYATFAGVNVEPGQPIGNKANAPAVVWGSPIMLKSDGSGVLWGFGEQGVIPPSSIQNHTMMFGSVQDTQDGNQFASVEIGPAVLYAKDEGTATQTDHNVEGATASPVTHVATQDFGLVPPPNGGNVQIHYAVHLEESGGRDGIFDIRIFKNGLLIFTNPPITLNNNDQLISGTFTVDQADLPINTSDTIRMDVEGTATHSQCVMFVRGSFSDSVIDLREEYPAPPAAFSAIAVGVITDISDAYRLTNAGAYTLPETKFFYSLRIKAIYIKNASGGDITLNRAGADVIHVSAGSPAETSIVIADGDGLILMVAEKGFFDATALGANTKNIYELIKAKGDVAGDDYDDTETPLTWFAPVIGGSANVTISGSTVTINKSGVYKFSVSLRTDSGNRTELEIRTFINTGGGLTIDPDEIVSDYVSRDGDQDKGGVTLDTALVLAATNVVEFRGFGDTDGPCVGLNEGTRLMIERVG